jgi:hypothetical protein
VGLRACLKRRRSPFDAEGRHQSIQVTKVRYRISDDRASIPDVRHQIGSRGPVRRERRRAFPPGSRAPGPASEARRTLPWRSGRRTDELHLTSDPWPLTSDWEVAQPAERAVVTRKVLGSTPSFPANRDDRGRTTEDGIDSVICPFVLPCFPPSCAAGPACVRQRALPRSGDPGPPRGQGRKRRIP